MTMLTAKQAALNGDPDAASPEQVLALLECVDALRMAVQHPVPRLKKKYDKRGIKEQKE